MKKIVKLDLMLDEETITKLRTEAKRLKAPFPCLVEKILINWARRANFYREPG